MVELQFDGSLSLMQLKCSGMTSVLELMEHGYPSRAPFGELYNMYKEYLPKELKQLNPKTFCEAMLHSLRLQDKDFKFGLSRVFFRPGKFAEFDKIMKSDPENLKAIVANVKKFLVKSRWVKAIFCAITVIKSKKKGFVLFGLVNVNVFPVKNKIAYRRRALVTMQKTIRGHLVRKRHGARIKFIRKIRGLDANLKQIENSAGQLKKDKESSTNEINQLKSAVNTAIDRIKVSLRTVLEDSFNAVLFSAMTRSHRRQRKRFTRTW